MVCDPDCQLLVRHGLEEKATGIWATASRVHLNLDFTFGSQALAVAFTDVESIGGRVWPNVIFSDKRHDFAYSIWSNSTLGLLSYWWHSNRQQSSKAGMTIRSAVFLSVLDFRALTDEQLRMAEAIFNEFRDKELKPAYLADADPNRALLDRRVVCDLLGFDEETYVGVRRLAAKWCAEPSVHGGKARPQGARRWWCEGEHSMQDVPEPLILAAIGAFVGALLLAGGLLLLKEFAEMILRINPWHAGVAGAILGALALPILSWWNNQRPRRR